jgi:hypothetical protein
MPIRDRWQYMADSVALGNEYKAMAGKPTRGYTGTLSDLFIYKSDPGETAYYANKDNVVKWKKKTHQESSGGGFTDKGNALYNVKMSIRYNDQEAFKKYLLEYIAYGGTAKGLKQSLKSLHPLYGLSKANQKTFILQLDSKGREDLAKSMDFYKRILSGEG